MRVNTTILALGCLALGAASPGLAQTSIKVATIGGGPLTICATTAGYHDGNTLLNSQFNAPYATAVDSTGTLYLADRKNNAIRVVSQAGQSSSTTSTIKVYGIHSTNLHAFTNIVGVATDPQDNFYALLPNGGEVQEYSVKFAGIVADVNPAFSDTATAFAVAQDGSGRVFVASTNSSGGGTIWRYDMLSGVTVVVYTGDWSPAGLTLTPGGRLVASDLANNAIYALDTNAPTTLTLVAGGNGAGYADGPTGISMFNQPHGVVASSDGQIAVADTGNNFVRQIDALGNTTTIYGTRSDTWGATDCNSGVYAGWKDGAGGENSVAQGRQPVSVSLSRTGTLFVTELFYNTLRDVTGTGLTAVTSNSVSSVTNTVTLPPAPAFNPSAGYFPLPQLITVISLAPNVFYTTNGAIPTSASPALPMTFVPTNVVLNQGYYTGTLLWANSNADLSALRFVATNNVGSSAVSSGIGIAIPTPVFGPDSGYFATNQIITITSLVPNIYITTDGSLPTTNSTKITPVTYFETNASPSQGYFVGSFVWSNAQADLSGLRIISTLTTGSSLPANGIAFVIPAPTFSPNSGYYPDCIPLSITSSVQTVYYTIDGTTPTTNSLQIPLNFVVTNAATQQGQFVGTFQWCNPGIDLSTLRLISALGNSFSPVAAGINPLVNQIGFTRTTYAGVGSTVVIPLVADLRSDAALQSLQFRLEINPADGNPPAIASPYTLLPVTNDFVTYPPPGPGPVIFDTFPYTISPTEQGMVVEAEPGSGLTVQNFAVLALLKVRIPSTAVEGQRYAMSVVFPSGTSDALQTPISLTNLPTQYIVVSNIAYFSGDSSAATGYNAGEFGDGKLDNVDVNNALYASVGIHKPFVFSDAYNAMDVYPELPGFTGDGFVNFLDWQTILRRSLGVDPSNWARFWTDAGIRGNSNVTWTPFGPPVKLDVPAVAPGAVWATQATLGAQSQSGLVLGLTCTMPVYVNVQPGSSLSGLQFRAIVTPNGGAPTPAGIQFNRAAGLPAPLSLNGLSPNDIIRAWSLGSFAGLQGSNYLGSISFQIPLSAKNGQSYSLHFVGVDGAPNISTAYQLESFPATAMVGNGAIPVSLTSDEWKAHFFGDASNPLAADNMDADGDGQSNWQEYLAGTDPTDGHSSLQFSSSSWGLNSSPTVNFGWLTAPGKTYVLETRAALSGNWSAIKTNLGDGYLHNLVVTNFSGSSRFYRIRLQP
ncbi:MAG TPA: chitobiase/beta-hexosaminidase C-terminal domain-containing protein [Verrucomicrobiae bacterium]|jgi:hypothetical protein|nr:chitobiase/beta-hexosaminidase C-terminal domain-containing protein [Verrucomicrobiae bacterium]